MRKATINKTIIVGIDLGTTYSCCYYHNTQQNKYEAIQYMDGKTTMASCVDFNKPNLIIGVPNQYAISEVKRLIGVPFNDEHLQNEIKNNFFHYHIEQSEDGYCQMKVEPYYTEETFILTPEEISSIILKKIRNEITRNLRIPMDSPIKAIVTVPAYFRDEQKERTKYAAMIAGFESVELLPEPTAAAYAYQGRNIRDGYYLAFDLGGGTFDLTIMKTSNNGENIEYVVTTGDTHLGGMDFDKNFAELIIEKWEQEEDTDMYTKQFKISGKLSPQQIKSRKLNFYRLKKVAEKTKIELSSKDNVMVDLSDFNDGEFIELFVTREDFEECNQHLFDRCMEITLNAIESVPYLTKDDIQEIVLIGGSSQIPKIQQMLQEEFPYARINNKIDCNEVVAQGAAKFGKEKDEGMLSIVKEVTSHTISLDSEDGKLPIVSSGTILPHEHQFYVSVNGTYARTELFEDNVSLGTFEIKNIPVRDNYCIFSVSIDNDGLLQVYGKFSNGMIVNVKRSIARKTTDINKLKLNKEKIDKIFLATK